ncbi:MAG: glycosyltransferase family 39 protein [Candidatus Zixiibacteriota bacterium]
MSDRPGQTAHTARWERRSCIGLVALFVFLFPLALIHGDIQTDEAWLGQQVLALVNTGEVASALFRDVPPLDGHIVVYHKLLIWCGAAISRIAGWGILQLRLIPALAGLGVLLLLLFRPIADSTRRVRFLAASILAFTPLFWDYMRMFRPEMLLLVCGFAGYLVLERATVSRRLSAVAAAGALTGLAGLSHAAGLAFVVAGVIALGIERQFKAAGLFVICAALTFSPYLSGLITDPDLFGKQLFVNAFTDARLSLAWWQPITNLLSEHTRLFRKPEVIGLSVAFVLALALTTKSQWRQQRFFWVFLLTLIVAGGMAPLPKITRYMLPLTPFFVLAIARAWAEPSENERIGRMVRKILVGWLVLFFAYGIFALGSAALCNWSVQRDTNQWLSAQIEPGSIVMAPFDFVFNGSNQYVVQSWWGCERAAHELPTPASVEEYASRTGVQYIILDSLRLAKLHLVPEQIPDSFRRYSPLLGLTARQRYLLVRKE